MPKYNILNVKIKNIVKDSGFEEMITKWERDTPIKKTKFLSTKCIVNFCYLLKSLDKICENKFLYAHT